MIYLTTTVTIFNRACTPILILLSMRLALRLLTPQQHKIKTKKFLLAHAVCK